MTKQTYGEKAVGLNFNPSGESAVTNAKRMFAELIDEMNTLRNVTTSENVKRYASISITELQQAQMWVVKTLTWED